MADGDDDALGGEFFNEGGGFGPFGGEGDEADVAFGGVLPFEEFVVIGGGRAGWDERRGAVIGGMKGPSTWKASRASPKEFAAGAGEHAEGFGHAIAGAGDDSGIDAGDAGGELGLKEAPICSVEAPGRQ